MHGGLENAPLRLLAAETVISAVLSIHRCESTGARLLAGCSQPGAECKGRPIPAGCGIPQLRGSPSPRPTPRTTVLQPETHPLQPSLLPSLSPSWGSGRQPGPSLVLRFSPPPPASFPFFLPRTVPQFICCMFNPLLVPASQRPRDNIACGSIFNSTIGEINTNKPATQKTPFFHFLLSF